MSLFLGNVRSAPSNQALIQRLNKISPALGNEVKKILAKAVDETAEYVLKGYKSVVPIDTGELRGLGLGNGQIQRTITSRQALSASIFVSDETHLGRFNRPKPASRLAEILNTGDYRRSNTSASIDRFRSIGKGSPTAGWIEKGDLQIKRGLRAFLNSRNFND